MKIFILFFFNSYIFYFCNKNILISFGLSGLKKTVKTNNYICPNLKHSCCNYNDQKTIYFKYVLGNEIKNINNFYDNYYISFNRWMESFILVKNYANFKLKLYNNNKSSINCRLMAKKLNQINFIYIKPMILKKLKFSLRFFKIIKKGFYCMWCDHKSHKFISEKENKITFNKNFCSLIIEKNLNFLRFKFINLPKITMLINNFLFKCTYNFNFKKGKYIKRKFIFGLKSNSKRQINSCINSKQRKNWFIMCKSICENIQVNHFSTYFFGDINKIYNYSNYIKNKIKLLLNPLKLNNTGILMKVVSMKHDYKMFKRKHKKYKNQRVLTQNEVNNFNKKFHLSLINPIKYEYKNDFNIRYNFNIEELIYKKSPFSTMNFNLISFGEYGINLYIYGINTQLNKRVYKYYKNKNKKACNKKKINNKTHPRKIQFLQINYFKFIILIFILFIK